MRSQNKIIDCYNKTASAYSDKFGDELNKKHLDRILLAAFASENKAKGKLIDLGCGPGQTTKYLFDCGLTDSLGTDVSPEMIKVATHKNPQLSFETGDMLCLPYKDNSFGSAVSFYSIVHFEIAQVQTAFKEINRVLTSNGGFLLSFHVGDDIIHLDNFLEHPVDIDFVFFHTATIKDLLTETGFEIIDIVERQPYEEIEYLSKRAYIWSRKI